MQHRHSSLKNLWKPALSLLPVLLITILTACSSQQAAGPTQEIAAPTPPPPEIPGRWTTYVAENQSHERAGITIRVRQLRFGTAERLFPNATETELAELGLDGTKGVLGVFLEVQNRSENHTEVFPGGDTVSVVLNSGEELMPLSSVSDIGRRINIGNTRNFLVVFPIVQTELKDITEVTYRFDELEFHYTDLTNVQGPLG